VLGYQLGHFHSAHRQLQSMPNAAKPSELADSSVLEARAWRSLLAATNAREGGPERSDDEQNWLISLGDRLAPAPSAPASLQSLLQLYTPLCTTRAGQSLTFAQLGQSLDGYIATATGDSYYVTGPDNVRHLHRLRALSAAIVVGAGTVARDDPQLTVRHVDGNNPVRVVLDPAARLDAQRRVFTDGAAPTLVVRAEGNSAPPPGNAEVLHVPVENGGLNLEMLLARLHERGLFSVFIEGGGETVSRFLEAGLLDRLHLAVAPLIMGRGRSGLTLAARDKIAECLRPAHRVFTMGGDVLFDCDLRAAAPAATGASGALERVL
jgi:diaminohydroxyphosphoribosylaminopyrimidine deaminase/5-amino-6-(5-phosphoribosylamino)uracil reductase